MIKRAFVGAALAVSIASPALALEHEVVIDHAAGPIAADYRGSVKIETRQIGTAGVSGRPSTLRCQWTASLNVERVAKVGAALQSRRTLTSDDVAGGARAGWCPSNPDKLEGLIDVRSDEIRSALLAIVEQDREAILAEADTTTTRS